MTITVTKPTMTAMAYICQLCCKPMFKPTPRPTEARDVTHCEIDRRKPHVLGEVLVPGGAAIGSRHQLLERGSPRGLIRNERGTDVARMRERPVEGNRIFHCEARARADREMCRVQRVADKDAVVD